jgi:hypothetical protein
MEMEWVVRHHQVFCIAERDGVKKHGKASLNNLTGKLWLTCEVAANGVVSTTHKYIVITMWSPLPVAESQHFNVAN